VCLPEIINVISFKQWFNILELKSLNTIIIIDISQTGQKILSRIKKYI